MDADIVCSIEEANYYYKKYLPTLYKEMNKCYEKLLDKLYDTQKHSEYRFQISVIEDP